MQEIKKIVILGPESTGKSTLCKLLADHFNSLWCPEYAREYLLKHGTNYTFDSLLTIAKGQVALEQEYMNRVTAVTRNTNKSLLFVDTDMYVMKVWCEYVFGKCHQYILDKLVANDCDLYLLCNTDLPWVKDELREYPHLETREELYRIYKDIMVNQNIPWVNITGNYAERFLIAVDAVNKHQFIS